MKFSCTRKYDTAASRKPLGSIGLALAVCIVIATSWCNSTLASAQQSSTLSAVYGRGVHAYFAGNSALAEQLFTQVIQSGSNDPRPYYFRGVLRMGMGRQHEAENDMRIGASFEARNPGVQHSIGRALQRVQGTNRRKLENFRRQARVDRLQQNRHQSQQRYEYLDRRAPAILRQEKPLTLTQPMQAPKVAPRPVNPSVAPAKNIAPQPTTVEPPVVVDKAPEPIVPPVVAEDVQADPFGDEEPVVEPMEPAVPTETSEEADPFGDPLAPEAAEETEESDPFGAEAADEDMTEESDPFGEATSDPIEEVQPADENDPFGADEGNTFAADDNPAPMNPAAIPPGEMASAGPVPGGDLFFAIGHWLGSQTNARPAMPAIGPGLQGELATEDFQFGPDSEGGAAPAGFPAATETAEMPPVADAKAEAATTDDPFGEDTTIGDDPFGEEPPAKEAVEDDPFAEEDTTGVEDPFGGEEMAEEAEETAAEEDDPFGGEDDPFAEEL